MKKTECARFSPIRQGKCCRLKACRCCKRLPESCPAKSTSHHSLFQVASTHTQDFKQSNTLV
ncbi:hypothetical protein EIKCOROL_01437 [Eikenella corrodens ATCC 23834]|uniref:Uncharacterized protein n=1 Tax=Eikenella corrodens ATCC 23834 TaxID=546274 RepID=C0DVP8_EIKCO|nr:hypothetical protein EIKCOROL_01437 [Eikenella corrodens ATCC 23834]